MIREDFIRRMDPDNFILGDRLDSNVSNTVDSDETPAITIAGNASTGTDVNASSILLSSTVMPYNSSSPYGSSITKKIPKSYEDLPLHIGTLHHRNIYHEFTGDQI